MSGIRMRRVTAAAASIALVASGALLAAAPAQAAEKLAPCTWESKDRENTFNCGKASTKRPRVPIVDCWKHQPSDRTYVQRKTPTGWVRADVPLQIRQGAGCGDSHPWKTVLRLPTDGLSAYETARYRLTMPATSGTDSEGIDWAYGKTVVDFDVCLVRPTSTKTC